MTLAQKRQAARGGFTLIELLVVITIIAILMSLSMAAVFRIFINSEKLNVTSDLRQLTAAVSQFKSKYHVDYIPSRMVLREQGGWDMTNPIEAHSFAYLKRVFGSTIDLSAATWHDWNGNGVRDTAIYTLEGDQCLVFFLGGIPQQSGNIYGCTGFNSSPRTPAAAGGDRIGPFFTFKSNRLQVRNTASPFPSYVDGYERTVYAYFSNYGRRNGYNKFGSSDCASLGLSPFARGSNDFYNDDSFQIISAGKDGRFGAGGIWPPDVPDVRDNLSNFFDGFMTP